jgi:cytochrome c oxidase subunit II
LVIGGSAAGDLLPIWAQCRGGESPEAERRPGACDGLPQSLPQHGDGRRVVAPLTFGVGSERRFSAMAPRVVPAARAHGHGCPPLGAAGKMLLLTRATSHGGISRVGIRLALALIGVMAFGGAGRAEQPHDWQLGMQPPATPVDQRIQVFHNDVLMPIITVITVFVLGLLLYTMIRFHHSRSPNPTRTTHNPVVEIAWTVVPVLILVAIAIPSFKLMYYMARVPPDAMTIRVTGHQWYWSYAYPEQKISFDSNMVEDKDLKPGQPRHLTVDNPLVVPADTNVRVLITSTDVIHSWFVPSFGVQEYAIIGRTNQSWFNVIKPGTYYGECNQICGINHSHMPIEVVALAKPDFDKWLADAKKKFADAAPDNSGAPRARAATLVAAAAAGN